jgi:predicted N-formylglutamate amidohydrolase
MAASQVSENKQLQRTVRRRRGDGASVPFHYALAPRFTRQRAAAELRR